MTIEQAIQNCKDKAKELRANARLFSSSPMYDKTDISYTLGCADEQEQLAYWLEELVELKKQGEWEEPFEWYGKTYHKCTNCHISSQLILINNYCPYCGAKMKGGAE